MKIYNTLTRKKEEFTPIEEGKVRMYVCGPTVYNLIHIGNARPMIIFDTVRRYFEYKGYDVNYVSNFTDVDDKIIKAANENGEAPADLAKRFIEECRKDMESMAVRPATTHPLATQEIDGMIEMISTLIEKGHAYAAPDGTVYFRVRSFKAYGKLSHRDIDDLEAGHREIKVTGEEMKEDPFDFVLWKPMKEGEPFWESPWSKGRPGWHIECSVMAKRYLGDTIDIHAGGEDLIFPHHENEIAQSEAANGVPFSNYWMHNGFLNIDNKKMSKSLGNFFTVRDIEKKYEGQVLRFFMLSAHYRSPLNFSDTLMESAKTGLERIVNAVVNLREKVDITPEETPDITPAETPAKTPGITPKDPAGGEVDITPAEQDLLTKADSYRIKFEEAMDDDFNTADAVSAVFELVRFINSNTPDGSSQEYLKRLLDLTLSLTDVLGIDTMPKTDLLDADIEALIEERNAARKEKNFARADEIRDELLNKGIILEDTREGVKWKRA